MTQGRKTIVQFARTINRNDWIDVVLCRADCARFRPVAVTLYEENIAKPQFAEGGGTTYCLRSHNHVSRALELARIIRKERAALLYSHHYMESLIGTAASALTGVPHVIGRHYEAEIHLLTRGLKRMALLQLEQVANRHARVIAVPSMRISSFMNEHRAIAADKVAVLPYPLVDDDVYAPVTCAERAQVRAELGLEGDAFVIGNVARHHALKGQTVLIEAFASFQRQRPEARLVLIGDGPAHDLVRDRVHAEGFNTELPAAPVVILGWRRDARRLLAAFDVLVHPSRHEALPQIMLESMARGVPVIIGDVSGVRDTMTHGVDGYILPGTSSNDILQSLQWAIVNRKALREMARQSVVSVRARLDPSVIVPQYEQLFEAAMTRA